MELYGIAQVSRYYCGQLRLVWWQADYQRWNKLLFYPVDAYDDNLASTTVVSYAIFGGGMNTTYSISLVDTYSGSLTRSTPTKLSVVRSYLTAATTGAFALFAGGIGSPDIVSTVDAYNKTLKLSMPTGLSVARGDFTATTVGNYALFCGSAASRNYYATVDAYDGNLTRSVLTGLDDARSYMGATTIGNYALFGGGAETGYYTKVDVYGVENLVLQATVYKGSNYKFKRTLFCFLYQLTSLTVMRFL